jgi:hypothetical protein
LRAQAVFPSVIELIVEAEDLLLIDGGELLAQSGRVHTLRIFM